MFAAKLFAEDGWPAGLHFVVLRFGLLAVAVILALMIRSRILKRVWGMGWRRAAIACGIGAVLFYVVWIVYLGGVMLPRLWHVTGMSPGLDWMRLKV
ncbi:hypothetical protein AHiyo6_20260 [Arthrobacter sp. Hiyo6]|nr:hypothetical protein AHiyo6_20260 [Arthrobacter sp. Hiyo6]